MWLAALFEGEGCFTPVRTRKTNSTDHCIAVTSIDRDVLETIKKRAKCGAIYGPFKVRKPTHRPTYQWYVRGVRAERLMRRVYPLMHKRRQEQIQNALKEVHDNKLERVNIPTDHPMFPFKEL